MNRVHFLTLVAGLTAFPAIVGCSGSVTDGPGGSVGGNAGTSPTAGGGGVGGSGVAGTGVGGTGVGGTGVGGTGVGGTGAGPSTGGNAGTGGGCTEGASMPSDCNTCQCHGGQWACTEIACPVKSCGGFVGNTCGATEYCAYMPGQACGAADASSTCQPRPSGCTGIYMPVCGCDSVTYPSDCDAAMHGQGVLYLGGCTVR